MSQTHYNSADYDAFCRQRSEKLKKQLNENPVPRGTLKFRNSINYHEYPSIPTVSSKPSMTTPDMSYSPQELIIRHAKGLPLNKLSNHSFHGSNDVPEIRKLDLTEQAELLVFAKNQYKSLTDTYEKNRAKRKENAAKQRADYLVYQAKQREAQQAKQSV